MSTNGIPDVYRVGLLKDLFMIKRCWKLRPERIGRQLYDFWQNWKAHYRRRSYWNGWLAELDGLPHCGHGWTFKRALASLERIKATQFYAEHKCGYRRLTAKVGRHYCMTCRKKTRWGWKDVTAEVER